MSTLTDRLRLELFYRMQWFVIQFKFNIYITDKCAMTKYTRNMRADTAAEIYIKKYIKQFLFIYIMNLIKL